MKKALLTALVLLTLCSSLYARSTSGQILVTSIEATFYVSIQATVNATVDATSHASSSTSSQSSAHTHASAPTDAEMFVLVNMDFLCQDIAAGAGDTISALAVLMNVDDASAFGKKLQANFDVIYPHYDVDYAHVANAIASFAL